MTYTLITAPYLVSRIIDGRDRAVSFKCTQRNRHRISRGARLPRRRPPGSLRYIWTSESKDSVPFFSRSSKRLITRILQKTRIPWTVYTRWLKEKICHESNLLLLFLSVFTNSLLGKWNDKETLRHLSESQGFQSQEFLESRGFRSRESRESRSPESHESRFRESHESRGFRSRESQESQGFRYRESHESRGFRYRESQESRGFRPEGGFGERSDMSKTLYRWGKFERWLLGLCVKIKWTA